MAIVEQLFPPAAACIQSHVIQTFYRTKRRHIMLFTASGTSGASGLRTFLLIWIQLCLLLMPLGAQAASVAPVAAENGMVVTAQHLATKVGVDVLKKGGNAVDAAIAVGYALAVVYPAAGNLGGGGFMLVQLADGRKDFLDFREAAPLAATATMYQDKDGNVIPRLSTHGHLAVAVPGTVAGLEMARQSYGSMARQALVQPSIDLARAGWLLEQGDADMFTPEVVRQLSTDPASAAIFLRADGSALRAGDRLVQKDLAKTLTAIAAQGQAGFYTGPVAEAIAASSKAGGGILTQADLQGYKARSLAPLETRYRGYGLLSAPPPSSGGVVIGQVLNILEAYPLHTWGFRSAKGVHHQIEALRHAFIDRNSRLGDPDFVNNPTGLLLSAPYTEKIRAAIRPDKAGNSTALKPGVAPHEGINTTHYSIVDTWGNAVAVTYTLNSWFGAGVTAQGTGVLLNNEMDDFTAKAGVPNAYGLIQSDVNGIAPGKRPLSSMSPAIVTRDNKAIMVLGSPGGSRIITTVLHTILNAIDYGMDIQEAVDAPKFHHQWQPDVTTLEPFALSPDTQALLEKAGHIFQNAPLNTHMCAIMVGAPKLGGKPVGSKRFYGANDPRRRTGLAMGY